MAALPIYEQLGAREIKNPKFAERLAFCLLSAATVLPAGDEREALLKRARFEAERARMLGDDSNLLKMVLEGVYDDGISTPSEETERLRVAEAAFVRGDLDTALAGYQSVAASDPGSYLARLYAGDVYFRKGNLKAAGEWFQQAIAIDPNVETAYRYWGDAISASGDEEAARPYFIKAVVAEPYGKKSWMGLEQWAGRTGAKVQHPRLVLPEVKLSKGKKAGESEVAIHLEPDMAQDKQGGAAWLAYGVNRSAWIQARFLERYPDEKVYRHSLDEEVESLQLGLTVLGANKPDSGQLGDTARELTRLGADGMLEAYVLLSAPDRGIAQDYGKYRDGHRETLATYIDKYVIRRGAAIE